LNQKQIFTCLIHEDTSPQVEILRVLRMIDKKEAEKILESSKTLDWYHKFEVELGSSVFTPGRLDTKGYQWRRDFVGLSEETLSGKRVLDIGAYSGAFSFLLQDLGADVVALDVYDPDFNGFNLVKKLRQRELEHHVMSIYDIDKDILGEFDIVACYGVHYHLRHPILAFERCNSVCKEGGLFIGGGTGMDRWFHDDEDHCASGVNFDALEKSIVANTDILSVENVGELPLCGFSPTHFLRDKTNWFIPNLTCLLSWAEACGFEVQKSHKHSAPVIRDWNQDERVHRTSLNFVSRKISVPPQEYTWKRMKQYRIPTQVEVDRLVARIEELEKQVS